MILGGVEHVLESQQMQQASMVFMLDVAEGTER